MDVDIISGGEPQVMGQDLLGVRTTFLGSGSRTLADGGLLLPMLSNAMCDALLVNILKGYQDPPTHARDKMDKIRKNDQRQGQNTN